MMIEIQAHLLNIRSKVQIGLRSCEEFLCDSCPYKEFDHPVYKIQCIHKLIEDINILYKENMISI